MPCLKRHGRTMRRVGDASGRAPRHGRYEPIAPVGASKATSLSVSDASVVIASIAGASFLVKERSRQERGADE